MPDYLPFCRPSIGDREKEAILAVLDSGWITTGPRTKSLEQQVCDRFGCQHAVAMSSATAAMHITLLALNIGPGDEVITPSQTWVSTINVIRLLGATPVFVDIDRDTLMVDAEAIKPLITNKTRAIIPVHYAGAPVDLAPIHKLASQYGLAVIEDAAHAIGTRYQDQWIGSNGTAIFSFHAIKNITCAEGGMLVTDDEALATRARRLSFHGLAGTAYDRQKNAGSPTLEVREPGYKYNLPDLNAALAQVQLERLDELNERRRVLFAEYQNKLAGLPVLPLKTPKYNHLHACHLFIIRVDPETCGMTRDQLRKALAERGIGTGIHFQAVHTHHYYRSEMPEVSLPNTEWNSSRLCTLPLFPDMSSTDIDRVVEALTDILGLTTE